MSNVAGFGDPRANVVVEVSRKVEDQIPNAVAVRVWPDPEFLRGERFYQFVCARLNGSKIGAQAVANHVVVRHSSSGIYRNAEPGQQFLS